MTKSEIKKARVHLDKIRQLMSRVSSPYKRMTKQGIINHIRKTREKLWEAKLAHTFFTFPHLAKAFTITALTFSNEKGFVI